MVVTALSDAIHAARMSKGHTQDEAASLVGVTRVSFDKWEKGATKPSAKHFAALASYLDADVPHVSRLARGEYAPGYRDEDLYARYVELLEEVGALRSERNEMRAEMRELQKAILQQQAALIDIMRRGRSTR